MVYDFGGYATKANLKCSDGRTIMPGAFSDQDGTEVPLIWAHQHGRVDAVLGHAILEKRDDGMYAYGVFNESRQGKHAKAAVNNGDVTSMSIWANELQQDGDDVMHGIIREVSLVLAGANPGAKIDTVIRHGEFFDDEAIIYTGENIELYHGEKVDDPETGDDNETVEDVVNTMTDKQRNVMMGMVGAVIAKYKKGPDDDENAPSNKEDNEVKHNIFDNVEKDDDVITGVNDDGTEVVISHAIQMDVISDAKRCGSMKESAIQHGLPEVTYGVKNLDYLFPEHRNVQNVPDFIQRDMGWVGDFMGRIHKVPFSRIKSMHADITADEARARGYIKGKMKKEEVFTLLKRTTDPTTVYKKQKMDRDDVIDITSFDVIAWIKGEMRMMLEEEMARAMLIGDGRLPDSDDKIPEDKIRPIWTDSDLYTIKARMSTDMTTATDAERAKDFIRTVIKSRKEYKGSGNPILFCGEDIITDCLLLEDQNGRIIYDSMDKLRTVLRVSKIVPVTPMEGVNRKAEDLESAKVWLMGLIVNPTDYSVGADKGGAVSMFDDFDIDYNQMKYLIETRASGALTKPKSAIAVEMRDASAPS